MRGLAAAMPGWRAAAVRLSGLLALVLALLGPATGAAPQPLPPLDRRVTDLTGTLSATQLAALEGSMATFEGRRGTQMAVLVVATTEPEPIEAYAIRVAEAWKIGRKGVDDGVIVILALADRRLRIEVGYGLEGALNDATSRRIIEETMLPRLRAGDTFGAIEAGVGRLQQVVAGEALPAPAGGGEWTMSMEDGGLFTQILVGMLILAGFLRSLIGRLAAGLLAAGVGGGAAWYFSGSWTLAALLAVILFVGISLGGGGGLSRGGRWGGGGGSSGGGFSGGGGRFGGGGASGRW